MSDVLTGAKARAAIVTAKERAETRAKRIGARVVDMRRRKDAGQTFEEIGRAYGISKQRVEQIVNEGRVRTPRPKKPKPPGDLTHEQRHRLLMRVFNKSGKTLTAFAEDDLCRDLRTARGWVHEEAPVPNIVVRRLRKLAILYGALEDAAVGITTEVAGTIIALPLEKP